MKPDPSPVTTRIAAFVTMLAVASSGAIAQNAPLVCNGSGRLVSSDVTSRSDVGYLTMPGSASDNAVTVEVVECGRVIIVHIPEEGQTLRLTQAALAETEFIDTVRIEGFDATFTMFRNTARILRGAFTVETPEVGLYAEMTLTIANAHAPDFAGCSDDPEPAVVPRGITAAHAALADALTATGRAMPAGAEVSNFISEQPTGPDGRQTVYVRLNAAGEILPSTPPELTVEDICAGGMVRPDPPVTLLQFKVFSFEATTTVFVQRIEIETGKIIEQREGFAIGETESSIQVAMLLSMGDLPFKPGGFQAGSE